MCFLTQALKMCLHGGKQQKQICWIIKLSFGLLKEYSQWDIEERNVCSKEVHFNEVSCTKVKFVFEQIGGKEENVIKEETKSWNETLKDIKEYGAL